MSGVFDFGTTGGESGDFQFPAVDSMGDRLQQPWPLAVALAAEVLVCLILFIPGGRAFNVAGYCLGAVGVSATAVAYRTIVRRRRPDPMYGAIRGLDTVVMYLLIAGVLSAGIHALFVAMVRKSVQ